MGRLQRRRAEPREVEEYDDYADEYEDEYADEPEEPARPARRSKREEERPARRTRSRDDEDEEPPRRSRRAREDDDARPTRPARAGRGTAARTEPPAHGRGATTRATRRDDEGSASRGSGWDTVKDARAKSMNKDRLVVKDKEVIVHFLEEEPFAVYEQHWLANRSYTCAGNRCPMCDRGYDTRWLALFNVVDMATGTNLYWEAGPNAAGEIQKISEGKYAPLNRDDMYYAVQRFKKSNNFYEFDITHIKEGDLESDFDVAPLEPDELDDALDNLFDDSVISRTSARDLLDVVKGIEDD